MTGIQYNPEQTCLAVGRTRLGLEILRETGLSRPQDLEYRQAVVSGQAFEFITLIPIRQHVIDAAVDAVPDGIRQVVESLAVDHVTQRIPEQPLVQVEIPQRASLPIARAALGKCLGER